MADEAGVVKRGVGKPLTLFAPGGKGENLQVRMRCANQVPGTKVGFAYGNSGHFAGLASTGRQADRDAAEVVALAHEHQSTRAIGVSRGARAIVSALAEQTTLFERVALVAPPGGTSTGKYSAWLDTLDTTERPGRTVEILVIGRRGDQWHPIQVATRWAEQLDAHLELFQSRNIYSDRLPGLLAEFFS